MNLETIFSGTQTRAKWAALGSYLKRSRITGGSGVRVSQDSIKGTLISATLAAPPAPGGKTIQPLTLVKSCPPYIPEGSPVAAGYEAVWVTWGFCGDRLPDNWDNRLDVPTSGSYTKYIYLKVQLASGTSLAVTSCAWETKTAVQSSPAWGSDGSRPSYLYILLGTIHAAGGEVFLSNAGGGSIQISEFISGVRENGTEGFTYTKSFSFTRTPV